MVSTELEARATLILFQNFEKKNQLRIYQIHMYVYVCSTCSTKV